MGDIDIYYAFEIALGITSFIPCLLLIIIYIFEFKKLKYPNYFKLEIIFSLVVCTSLSIIECKEVECQNNRVPHYFKIIGFIKAYIEDAIFLLLISFNFLCCILFQKKIDEKKKLIIIIVILSLLSWVLPLYLLFLYSFVENENKNKNDKQFYLVSKTCIFNPPINKIIHYSLISLLFVIDLIIYILSIQTLSSKKKRDKKNKETYNTSMIRISINFLSHFIFFALKAFNLFISKNLDSTKNNEENIYNIIFILSLNIISIFSLYEGKTREYWNKFIKFLKLQKIENNRHDDEEEEYEEDDDDDDEDDEQITLVRETEGEIENVS